MEAVGIWELWALLCKWLQLLACAGVTGGSFCLMLARRLEFPEPLALRRYLQASAVLGVVAVPGFLLAQIGGVNQSGWSGMFDVSLGRILLQSGLGQALQLRVLAFAMVLTAPGVTYAVNSCTVVCKWSGVAAVSLAVLLLGVSFAQTGHVSELSPVAQAVLVLHVLAVFLWMGALYPLLRLSRVGTVDAVQGLMHAFGTVAVVVVAILLAAGIYLAAQLLQSLEALWTTEYGRLLLLKLAGVGLLLLLAATNKLRLVPRLTAAAGTARLRWSIRAELMVGLLVLAVTAWLTTLVGPPGF